MQRLTRTTTRTLLAFLEAPGGWRYGYDLMRVTDLSSGTLYPLLARLTEDDWLESRWEEFRGSWKAAATGLSPHRHWSDSGARCSGTRAHASWLRRGFGAVVASDPT